MKQRLVWLDALKGIGILSIMRIHMAQPMELLQSVIYVGAVSMFFVSAGFNFKVTDDAKTAMSNKAKRLLIPYFAYSLLLVLVEHHPTIEQIIGIFYARMSLFQGQNENNISFLVIGNAPMWFLPCMFMSYMWIYLVYCKCRTIISKSFTLVVFVILSALLSYSPIMLPWSIDTSFLLASLLIIGYELKDYFVSAKIKMMVLSFALWFALFYFFAGSNISIGNYGAYGVISILPFAIISLSETYSISGLFQIVDNNMLTRLFAYIGRQSMRLMCIHLIVYIKVSSVLSSYFPSICGEKILLLAISFSCIFIINAIVDFILKIAKCKISFCGYL